MYINEWMCSKNCPCDASIDPAAWQALSTEELVDKYGRTLNWQFGPLDNQSFTVSSFEDCLTRHEENTHSEVDESFRSFAEEWPTSAGYAEERDFLAYFESEYTCAGICEPALFSFSRKDESLPTTCFDDMTKDVRDSLLYLGLSATGSGIMLLVIFSTQYCLWPKF